MDTRQLETLLAVAHHGGFAAAAQAVNLTASAVSQQMAALESEVDALLFDRSRRPPALTVKGAEMVRSARAILNIVSQTKESVSDEQMRGTLAFGTLRTGANSVVPNALATLQTTYPNLNFHLRVGKSEDLMSEVVTGQLDAALVGDHVAVPASLTWIPVINEPLIVLAPDGASGLTLDALAREVPFIRYRTEVTLARLIHTEIARLGVPLRQSVSVNTMAAVVGCVKAGLGFSVVPQIALQDMNTAPLNWFHFGTPPVHRRLGIAQRIQSGREDVLKTLANALSTYDHQHDYHE